MKDLKKVLIKTQCIACQTKFKISKPLLDKNYLLICNHCKTKQIVQNKHGTVSIIKR